MKKYGLRGEGLRKSVSRRIGKDKSDSGGVVVVVGRERK